MRRAVCSVYRKALISRGLHGAPAGKAKPVGVFGAMMNRGQGKEGVKEGPSALRNAGLLTQMNDCGIDSKDYGDVEIQAIPSDEPWRKVRYSRTVGAGCKQISDKMVEIIKDSRIPLMIGGDHASAIGSVAGHARAVWERHGDSSSRRSPISVLWVDAHADINTPLTTYTGNLHGCPVSFLLHETKEYVPRAMPGFDWLKPCLSADRIAYIGLRALDPDELFLMEQLRIKFFPMGTVDKLGIQRCIEEALDAINPQGDHPIHLSFDIDALDPTEAAATGTPVMGGLTLREGLQIVENVHSTGLLGAMDLVEINPTLGSPYQQAKTYEAAIALVMGALGKPRHAVPYPPGFTIPVD